jgi:hypothetical protein
MAPVCPAAERVLKGGCLCGAVQYEVTDAFRYALNCHCSQCRRATGAAFKPFGGIAAGALRLTSGESLLLRYGEPLGHDAHCGRCGALLYSLVDNGSKVHVTYGTLRDAPTLRPTAHIFVGSKAPWFTITDSLPQHLEFP